MTSFTSPNIPTDVDEMVQLVPEPTANALQKQLQTVQVIEYTQPSIQRVGGIIVPDVPYDYGWHEPQLDWPDAGWQGIPLMAPDVSVSTPAFTEQIQEAAKPVPTLAATGVYQALRAPGINEGLT